MVTVQDYLGNKLNIGDRVIFHDGYELTEGEILSFFYQDVSTNDKTMPPIETTVKVEVKDGLADTPDGMWHAIRAYIAYAEEYEADHYGHLTGDVAYTRYKTVHIHDVIKKTTEK